MSVTAPPQTVLVVDDEPQTCRLFSIALGERGLETLVAASGEDALQILAERGIGCLVTDKNLPGIDGIAVLQHTRRAQPHCACIVITGYASTQSAIEALRLGANDYLEKPFGDIELVCQKIENVMKAKRALVERDLLSERLRQMQGELSAAGHQLDRATTEIEMFEQVFQFRVQAETQELQKRVGELTATLRGLKDAQSSWVPVLKTAARRLGALAAPAHGVDVRREIAEIVEDFAVALRLLA